MSMLKLPPPLKAKAKYINDAFVYSQCISTSPFPWSNKAKEHQTFQGSLLGLRINLIQRLTKEVNMWQDERRSGITELLEIYMEISHIDKKTSKHGIVQQPELDC